MKSPTNQASAPDPDATPQRGGSYIRQPDGSLERVLTAALPAADKAQVQVQAPEPAAASAATTKE